MTPRHLSIINWLTPDENILQEWAAQLGSVPDGGIFPIPVTVPGGLLCTSPPLRWAPTSESTHDQALVQIPAAMASHQIGTENGLSETIMDAQSSSSLRTTSGEYYADNAPWRAPFQSRFRRGQAMGCVNGATVMASTPSRESVGPVANTYGTMSLSGKWIAEDIHRRILRGVKEDTQISPDLPSLEGIRLCLHLYFERLHPAFLFLRQATFTHEKSHWILSLTVAGVGAVRPRGSIDAPLELPVSQAHLFQVA